MPRQIKKGTTNASLYFFLQDSSDGSAETGITITGLDLQYVRFGAAPSTKVDATALAATDSAHADNKAIEIDATDQPGLYRVDWPDAAFAAGVNGVVLTVKGTGLHPAHMEVELTDFDPYDSVRMGMTALPNAAADAAGGLVISDAGGLDVDTKLANTNEVTAARMGALTDWINGGRLDLILDIIAADVVNIDGDAMVGTNNAALASVCSEARLAELAAANLPADVDTLLSRVTAAVALASVCTEARLAELAAANVPTDIDTLLTRLSAARAGYLDELAAANIPTDLTNIENDTAEIGAAGAGLSDIPWNASWDAEVQSEVDDAIKALHLDHLISVAGSVDDASPSSANFDTDLSETTNHHYDGTTVVFIDGALVGQSRRIITYTGSAYNNIAVKPSFTEAPANSDAFVILSAFTPTKNLISLVPIIPPAINLSNTASVRISLMFVDLLGATIASSDITPGTIIIQRKARGETSWSTIVNDEAMVATTGAVYFDEVFDSGSGYERGDRIRIIVADQEIDQGDGSRYFPTPGMPYFFTYILEDASDALDTVIPDSPTADSINERVKAMDELMEAAGDGDLAAILADTNELQAADILGKIAALNDPTTAEIATAVMAKVVDGSIDVTEALKVIMAMAVGDIAKAANVYTHDEQDGTVKVTEVLTDDAAVRTIA